MLEEKIKQLKALFGGDTAAEAKVDELLAAASNTDKAAEAANIKHKESAPTTAPEIPAAGWFVADMKPEEFTALLVSAMKQALEPMVIEIKAIKDAQGTATKEMGTNIVAEIAKVALAQKAVDVRVQQLEGSVPRAFRASQDASTVVTDEKLKEKKPGPDTNVPYLATFIGNMVGAQPQ